MKLNEKHTLIFCILLIVAIVLSPIIINELYKLDDGYITIWDGEEMLAYVSSVISAISTLFVSFIAITQTKKANEINDRLLKIEEINSVPSLSIVDSNCSFINYNEKNIHLKISVKNISNGIIDIKNVSDFELKDIITGTTEILNFMIEGLEYQTLLPGQEKQLDFFINSLTNVPISLCNSDLLNKCNYRLVLSGTFDIMLAYKESKTSYVETINICGYGKFTRSHNISISEQRVTRSDYRLEKTEE